MSAIPKHIVSLRMRLTCAAIAADGLRVSTLSQRLPCIRCICFVIDILCEDGFDNLTPRLRYESPELMRACADFLMLPRSTEKRHQLYTEAMSELSGCACNLSDPLIRDLHPKELDLYVNRDPRESPLSTLLTKLFACMSTAYSALKSVGSLRISKQARMRVKYQKRSRWPACVEDVLPYGMQQSIESILGWKGYCPYGMIASTLHGLFFSVAYPALPSILLCNILPHVTCALLDDTLQCATTRTSTTAENDFLMILTEIRTMFRYIEALHDDDILHIVQENNAHAEIGCLVTSLASCASKLGDILLREERRRGVPPGGCNDTHAQQYSDYRSVACCAARIWTALGRLPDVHEGMIKIWSETYLLNTRSAVERLAALATFIWNGHVCANVTCTHTPFSEGRPLPLCTGCSHTRYCSRRCQRIAWSDKRAPHRDICAQLRKLTRSVRPEFYHTLDEVKDIHSLRKQCEEAGLEDEMLQSIVNHCRIIYRR